MDIIRILLIIVARQLSMPKFSANFYSWSAYTSASLCYWRGTME